MDRKKELFERTPVPKALATLAIPTIISQLITMIYNLADTVFIGFANDSNKTAAATVSFVLVFGMNALANLFGVGGGTLISRLLGKDRPEEAKKVASFSFYGTIFITAVYSMLCLTFSDTVLRLVGANNAFILKYSYHYMLWVVVIGGIPATLSMAMAHLLRSEGYAKYASFGLGMGGVLNIILDPLFMFVILPSGQEVAGAAVATCISNVIAMVYFLLILCKLKHKTVLSISPEYIGPGFSYVREIFATGIPSALSALLACISNLVLNNLTANYGTEGVELAALGIVKKIDMLPLNVGMGLCQGMIPLVAYNYASGDHKRMKKVISACRVAGMGFALICVLFFEIFSEQIVWVFIRQEKTLALGSSFLRIVCLATPIMFYNLLATFSLQAMGKGPESLLLSVCRQGLVNIPLLFLLNSLFGLYGVVSTQLVADSITMIISTVLTFSVFKKLKEETRE
ncbi:MAG: MATE family efflux transporter [Ruminococcaceae bacterium]|nr:MATE family efflux transporter [Oscillospiraceae bacterium]